VSPELATRVDGDGKRPQGQIDKNRVTGDAMLVWLDGRTDYYDDASPDEAYEAFVIDNQSPDYYG
jgi:hypothetical protein